MNSLAVGIVAILLLASPLRAEPTIPGRAADEVPSELVESLNSLCALLARNSFYREALGREGFTQSVLAGVVRALGDQQACVVPLDSRAAQGVTSYQYSDLGLILDEDQFDRLVIASVVPGSPADISGIRPGDLLLRVDDTNTCYLSPAEVSPLLVGEVDTAVSLVVEGRNRLPRAITLVRSAYTRQTVILRIGAPRFGRWHDDPEGSIAWLKVSTYLDPVTKEQWNQAVQTIQESPGVRDIVLDLRDNGGGDNSCLSTLGDFFQSGEHLVTFESAFGAVPWKQEVRNFATPRARLICYPAVVMVDGNTASLAEIATAALRDLRNVPVIGETTYGKGTTQTWIRLDGTHALRLTAGRWYSPKGFCYNDRGIPPDIVVGNNPRTPRDEQLLEAVRAVRSR